MANRYLLESSGVDGYLLEDSSGVLLLDETTAAALTVTESGDTAYGYATSWQALDTYTLTPTITLGVAGLSATFGVTESTDLIAAGSTVSMSAATFGVTESSDTTGGLAAVGIAASLLTTESSDTLAASYSFSLSAATFGVTESSDLVTGAAGIGIAATLVVTESADTISAGMTAAGMSSATFTKTESGDTAYGFLSQWIPLDTYSVTPSITLSGGLTTGTFNVTESADLITASATIPLPSMSSATFGVTESADLLTSVATQSTSHPVGVISRLGFDGYGVRRVGSFAGRTSTLTGTFAVTETSDSLAATSVEAVNASLQVLETSDSVTAGAGVGIATALSVTEANDTIAAFLQTILTPMDAALVVAESSDTVTSDLTGGTPIPPDEVVRIPGAGRGRKLRILPDNTRLYATEDEVRRILTHFYRPKTLDDVKLLPKKVQQKFREQPVEIELVQFDKHVPKFYELKTEKRLVQGDYSLFLKALRRKEEEEFLYLVMEIL